MKPVLFAWGEVVIPSFGFFLAVGFLVGSFILWRQLREEHEEEELVSLSLFSGLCSLLTGRLVAVAVGFSRFGWDFPKWLAMANYPGLSLYGSIAGFVLGIWWFSLRRKWRFWEVFDAGVNAGLWVMFFGGIGSFLSGSMPGIPTSLPWGVKFVGLEGSRHPIAAYLSGFSVMSLFLTYWLRSRYRLFSWYPSGRSGFLSLASLILLSPVFLVLELLGDGGLYFWGIKPVLVLIPTLAFLEVAVLYQRSGRVFLSDRETVLSVFKKRKVLTKQKRRRKDEESKDHR